MHYYNHVNSIDDLVSRAMPYTMCHRDTLTQIAEIVSRMTPPIEACEIGSARGGSAIVILGAMDMAGGGHLTCIDDFKAMNGVAGESPWDNGILVDFVRNLEDPIREGRLRLVTAPSYLTQYVLGVQTIDIAFIDGSHTYDDCILDIESCYSALKPGGIICGDDYVGEPGVKQAVDEFFDGEHELLPGYLWYYKK